MSDSLQWLLDFNQQNEPLMNSNIPSKNSEDKDEKAEDIMGSNNLISDSARTDNCILSSAEVVNIIIVNKFKK
jgi:hypothetical protein